ncbi:MAG: SH3 domain-containing protein [Blautia sp.]|nr:SH3 domain-containing protein [Blautia sp.]
MKKRICAAICVLALMAGAPAAICAPVWAEEAETESEIVTYDAPVKKQVKPDMLRLRSKPSANSTAYGMLGQGTIVEVYGEVTTEEGLWYLTHTAAGQDAYLSGAYLIDPEETAEPAAQEEPAEEEAAEEETAQEEAAQTEETPQEEAAPETADESAKEEKVPSQADPEHGFIFVRNDDGTVTVTKY